MPTVGYRYDSYWTIQCTVLYIYKDTRSTTGRTLRDWNRFFQNNYFVSYFACPATETIQFQKVIAGIIRVTGRKSDFSSDLFRP
jgi:hypothetical protein